jgi:Phasin protein
MAQRSENEPSNWMVPIGVEAMMEMQRPALTAMAEANTKLYESIAAANQEWASFINRRLKEDLAVPQQLAECRSLPDLYRVYTQFFQNACSQYQSGFELMAKLGQSIAETALQPLQSMSEGTGPTKH